MSLDFFRISKGIRLTPQSGAPSSPQEGDLYFDNSLVKLRVYQNGTWVNITDSDGTVLLADGSAASPSLAFASSGNENTGLYLFGTDSLGFSANGTSVGNYSAAGLWTIGATSGTQTHAVNGQMAITSRLAVGTTDSSATALNGAGSVTSGASQSGISSDWTYSSAATTQALGIVSRINTQAASFTLPFGAAFNATAPIIGAGSTITRSIGLRFSGTWTGGTNNAYIADNTSFTGNYFINSTSTNPSVLSGRLDINSGGTTSTSILRVGGTATILTGTDQQGIYTNSAMSSAATSSIAGIRIQVETPNTTFTTAIAASLRTTSFVKGASHTITRYAQLLIDGTIPTTATGSAYIADNTTFTGNYFIHSTSTSESLISGDLRINTAGKGLLVKEGSNAKMGVATLVAGTVTVNTTAVTANSRIFLTHQNNSGTVGFVTVSARTASTSFTILSSNAADTSNIAWMIVEPA